MTTDETPRDPLQGGKHWETNPTPDAALDGPCRITRGLDGHRQCIRHRWEGYAEQIERVCPNRLAARGQ